jgi:hypothetical protein
MKKVYRSLANGAYVTYRACGAYGTLGTNLTKLQS